MAVLHLVFRSPGESRALEQCLARVGEGDAVLLLEDGVYAAAEGSVFGGMPRAVMERVVVYVLVPDLEARGLEIQNPLPEREGEKLREPYIEPVDYPGFVALTTEYNPIVSWT
jgi:tRNA 2-thiouridine synthesizing protein B